MIIITTVDDTHFSINGLVYLRNFLSVIYGNNVAIKNYYDSRLEIANDLYSNFLINGVSYTSALATQNALVDILYKPIGAIFKASRNILINHSFSVNQRSYASGSATTSNNQYTLDRWRILTSGGSITYANSTTIGGNKVVTIPPGVILSQIIDSLNISLGTYTLSWSGTATATVNGASVSNGGSVTLTSIANVTISFTGGALSSPQFERGQYRTEYEKIDYQSELSACLYYYRHVYGDVRQGGIYNTDGIVFQVYFLPDRMLHPMRVTPSVTNIDTSISNFPGTGFVYHIKPGTNSGYDLYNRGGVLNDGSIWNINMSGLNTNSPILVWPYYTLNSEI